MVPEETKSCWGFLGSQNSDWLLHVPILFFLSSVVDNCNRSCKVEKLISLKSNRTNVEVRMVNLHLYYNPHACLSSEQMPIHLRLVERNMTIVCTGAYRPGVTNTWNDLFIAHLSNIKEQSGV